MIRLQICLLFVGCSCAHVTEPVSQAPNLAAFLAQLTSGEPQAPAASVCPDWIKLEGTIDDDAATAFESTLAACADRSVVVEINSPGGNLFSALQMQKAIERHPHPVLCLVDGMAASAAFVTLQSCDIRLMTNRSVLMAHHAAVPQAGGQETQMENLAAALHVIDRAAALHCGKRMGLTPEQFETHVGDGREWWLGLEDGLAFHAVDREVADITAARKLANGATAASVDL